MNISNPLSRAGIQTSHICDQLEALASRTPDLRDAVRRIASPPEGRRHVRLVRNAEAAAALGCSDRWLRKYVAEVAQDLTVHADRAGRMFSPHDLAEIRRRANVGPLRAETGKACVTMFLGFKGGSGKSSNAVGFAQSMAARGYRVLLIDFDPQGSASICFDYEIGAGDELGTVGELDLGFDDTIGVLVEPAGASEAGIAQKATIASLARKTHWPTIDVIPACPDLLMVDFYSSAQDAKENIRSPSILPSWAKRFRNLMDDVRDYDIVVIDTPPAVNKAMLGVAAAADVLVVPVKCAQFDVDALSVWIEVQKAWFDRLRAALVGGIDHVALRFLLNDRSGQSKAEAKIENVVRHYFEATVCPDIVPHLEALKRGGGSAPSVFDLSPSRPEGIAASATKAREILNRAYSEIRELVESYWVANGGTAQAEEA